MTRSIADIVSALDRIAPFAKAADWDPVGLQIGDASRSAERVAVCHEITETAMERILAAPPSLVVTYHPLIFGPLNSLTAGPGAAGRALRLAEAGVAIVVMHTNFDAARGGTADSLAVALGLGDIAPFGLVGGGPEIKIVTFAPREALEQITGAMAAAGAGRIGTYTNCSFTGEGLGRFQPEPGSEPVTGSVGVLSEVPELRIEMVAPRRKEAAVIAALQAAHPYEETPYDVYDVRGSEGMVGRVGSLIEIPLGDLVDKVDRELETRARVAGGRGRPISRVAVVPGSGSDFIGAAAAAGSEVLVTGDVSHHRAREAVERGIAVIDAGHGPTERPGVQALYAFVGSVVSDVIDLTGIDDSPWEAG